MQLDLFYVTGQTNRAQAEAESRAAIEQTWDELIEPLVQSFTEEAAAKYPAYSLSVERFWYPLEEHEADDNGGTLLELQLTCEIAIDTGYANEISGQPEYINEYSVWEAKGQPRYQDINEPLASFEMSKLKAAIDAQEGMIFERLGLVTITAQFDGIKAVDDNRGRGLHFYNNPWCL